MPNPCWVVWKPIVAAVRRVARPRPRIFVTPHKVERAARRHHWIAAKVIGWSGAVVCTASAAAPFLIPRSAEISGAGPGFIPHVIGGPASSMLAVPEPSALSIMAVALIGLVVIRFVLLFDRRPLC